jgi:hypothetical protein
MDGVVQSVLEVRQIRSDLTEQRVLGILRADKEMSA